MGSRFYDSTLGRFTQSDIIIPEPYNPLSYERYQYVYSNPVRHTDSSGHCIDGISTWVCFVAVISVISKVVDYGWTTYDAWQSGQILNDPNASQAEKDEAAANLAMAATFEGLEPDDLLPISLPLDDLARHGILGIAKQLPLPGFEKYVDDAATQLHHLITDKNSYWTGVMRGITDKYKLDLNGMWNKIPLPGHSGKHTDQYHQWMYDQLVEIDALAKGNINEFLRLFDEKIKDPVMKKKQFYELSFQEVEDGLVAHRDDLQEAEKDSLLQGILLSDWPSGTLFVEGKHPTDYLFYPLRAWHTVSKRVKTALESSAIRNIQFLPIRVEHRSGIVIPGYCIMNILSVVPALSYAHTEWVTPERENVPYPQLNIWKVALQKDKVQGLDVFRLAETKAQVFVSEDFKHSLERNNFVVGIKFIPVAVVDN